VETAASLVFNATSRSVIPAMSSPFFHFGKDNSKDSLWHSVLSCLLNLAKHKKDKNQDIVFPSVSDNKDSMSLPLPLPDTRQKDKDKK
jgi:hypothetical protein